MIRAFGKSVDRYWAEYMFLIARVQVNAELPSAAKQCAVRLTSTRIPTLGQ